MGITFTGLKVDWKAGPRVKVLGVTGVDRTPATFYDLKLDDPLLTTAFVVWVDESGRWKEFYVNNWLHPWGEKADKVVHGLYAGREAPYDVYGFINGQSAPFSARARALIAQHRGPKMFHGLVAENPSGYELDVPHLVGPDKDGNGVVLYGD